MFDLSLTSLTETNRILRHDVVDQFKRIADALERMSPPPPVKTKGPRETHDLLVTNDETLADIEDEEERKRMVPEED